MDDDVRTGAEPVRVFLLDDHPLVREALAERLGADPEVVVVGTAGDVDEALAGIAAGRPDVAVLDARLRHGSGMAVCRTLRIHHPEVRCVLLTSHPDQDALVAARVAGASGLLLKTLHGSEIVDGIKTVARGGTLAADAPDGALQPLVEDLVQRRRVALDPQQRAVLAAAVRGDSDDEIAAATAQSTAAVRGQLDVVLADLGLGGAAVAR